MLRCLWKEMEAEDSIGLQLEGRYDSIITQSLTLDSSEGKTC